MSLENISATVCIGFAAVMWLQPLPASAERILYLDAAAPGILPGVVWADQTTNEYDFVNRGAIHNPGLKSYTLDNPHGAAGQFLEGSLAHEAAFDFERDSAWSVVVYAKQNGDGQHTEGVLSKVPANQNMGWEFAWRKHDWGWYEFVRANTNADRSYKRVDSGSIDLNWHLVVITCTGPDISNVSIYEDGVDFSFADAYTGEPQVGTSILNDEPVRIGYEPFSGAAPQGAYFTGEIGFIEIWNEALPEQYAVDRWNGGSPARATVSPDRPQIVFQSVQRAAATGLIFQSVFGERYELQSTTETNPPNWTAAGLTLEGTGGQLTAVDPAGVSTQKTYRVLRK